MSARDKLVTLLERLVALSEEGKVAWAPAESAPTSYEFVTPGGDKVVIDSRDDDAAAPYDLIVYSATGEIIGKLEWRATTPGAQVPPRNRHLSGLYVLARDKVSGATDVIQRVLDELPRDDDIPF